MQTHRVPPLPLCGVYDPIPILCRRQRKAANATLPIPIPHVPNTTSAESSLRFRAFFMAYGRHDICHQLYVLLCSIFHLPALFSTLWTLHQAWPAVCPPRGRWAESLETCTPPLPSVSRGEGDASGLAASVPLSPGAYSICRHGQHQHSLYPTDRKLTPPVSSPSLSPILALAVSALTRLPLS
jgi:hypothetical protein